MQLTKELLLWLFEYDDKSGKLYWKNHWVNNRRASLIGKEVGVISPNGYRHTRIDGKDYLVHRLIYQMQVGFTVPSNLQIDHVNNNKLDNRFINLRVVNSRRNHRNRKAHNQGKLVGASFRKDSGRWRSIIHINGKNITVGNFNTELEAHIAYIEASKRCGVL